MKELKKLSLVSGCVLLFIVFYILCSCSAKDARNSYSTGAASGSGTVSGAGSAILPQDMTVEEAIMAYVSRSMDKTVRITAVGDIMFYDYQMSRAYDSASDSFDFSPSFTYIKKYYQDSSLVTGNFEGTMAGKNNGIASNELGYWSDAVNMNFNIPEAAAKNLASSGFTMLTTANNHAMDSGLSGLNSTIDYIEAAGLDHTGTFKSESDSRYLIKNVDGILVGMIAYTNSVNVPVDDSTDYVLNSLQEYSDAKITLMCSQIQEMRGRGAEFVIVSLHFGTKYSSTVDEAQRALAKRLIQAGADVILGSHTHIVCPMELMTVTEEDGSTRTGAVFYSLGNFLTSMQYQANNGYNRDMGVLVNFLLTKSTADGVRFKSIELVPVYTDWTASDLAVLPICEAHDREGAYSERFENDDAAYLDTDRINKGYEWVIKALIGDSNIPYAYRNYKYEIVLEK